MSTLRPFPGQVHLDVAGGTGDVAFRVLAALRREERLARLAGSPAPPGGLGSVLVSDINPAMLAEGRKRADAAGYVSADVAVDEHGLPTCVWPGALHLLLWRASGSAHDELHRHAQGLRARGGHAQPPP